jgi:hypothetical protein
MGTTDIIMLHALRRGEQELTPSLKIKSSSLKVSHPKIPISKREPFSSINVNFLKKISFDLSQNDFILYLNELKESNYLNGEL